MHTVLCGLDRRPSVEALEGEVSALRQQIMELNRREVENLQELEDEGEIYEGIEDIWPDYPSQEDFFFNEDEY
jgi:hypothetical protein